MGISHPTQMPRWSGGEAADARLHAIDRCEESWGTFEIRDGLRQYSEAVDLRKLMQE